MAGQSFVGAQVGQIRLERVLGAGGMGEVYLGYDSRLDRRVAVKTIRAEQRFDPEMKSRFLREARILSKLEHPAICQVYELVEGSGADFLVFEYVEGKTLKELFASGPLDTRRTLEIAEKIAQALAAAHRERIVHRDLKPENVMVTAGDGVKILDFGISRAVKDAAGGEAADAEASGSWSAAGMAPPAVTDQATAAQARPVRLAADGAFTMPLAPLPPPPPVDPREGAETEAIPEPLATGPLAGATAANPAATRLFAGRSPGPPPAETAAVTFDTDLTQRGFVVGTARYMSPEQANSEPVAEASDLYSFGILLQEMLTGQPVYAQRSIDELRREVAAARTRPMVEGDADLVALVARLKSRSPPARPTAVETAERLRFVLDKPAREAQRRRRRRLAAAAFGLLCLVLLVVSVLAVKASREAQRANREARRAASEAANARAVSSFVLALFEQASPANSGGKTLGARELIDRGAELVRRDFGGQPLQKALFEDAIGLLYWRLGFFAEAHAQLESALIARESLLPEGDPELARSRHHLALVATERDDFPRAEELFRQALAVYREQLPASSELAGILNDLAYLHQRRGDARGALPLLEEALAIDAGIYGDDSLEVADRRTNLAFYRQELGDYRQALELYRAVAAAQQRHGGQDSLEAAQMLNNQGILLREMGEPRRAEELHRRALAIALPMVGAGHPQLAAIHSSLGRALAEDGRGEEAHEAFVRALAIEEAARGRGSLMAGRLLAEIADVERAAGRFEPALAHLVESRAVLLAAGGEPHPYQMIFWQSWARLEKDRGHAEEARAALERAVAVARVFYDGKHPKLASAVAELGELSPKGAH